MIYQVIENDLFNISKRIKAIDKKYFVVFNKTKHKFEVHYSRSKNTYELTIPYKTLDARAVDFVLKTRVQNQQRIIDEIEKSNQELERKNTQRILENANRRLYES